MTSVKRYKTEILVIGCGAAGMACASAAAETGASVIAADERKTSGGVLPQCVHKGFGLGRYGKEMTGPEYNEEEYRHFENSGAVYMPGSRVLSISSEGDAGKALLSHPGGICEVYFMECVLAMIELGGYDIGDRIFILGSGDIGQIMARRFRQLGKTVICMAEIKDHLGGMKRNQEECIKAYDIPVMLRTTITEIHGYPHLTGVTVHHIDTDEYEYIECETLISSLGLIPDKSLADGLMITDANGNKAYPEWLHFCGNADYVHDITDSASSQGEKLGRMLANKLHQ